MTLKTIEQQIERLDRHIKAGQVKTYSSPEEEVAFSLIQSRADAVLNEYGKRAATNVPPWGGETPFEYRRRLAEKLAEQSRYADTDLSNIPDAAALAPVEAKIYADALANAKHPLDLKPGELRAVQKIDHVGRKITEFVGDKATWMKDFKKPVMASPIYVDGVPKTIGILL